MMGDSLRFYLNRLQERLWVRPLFICILSVLGAFVARFTDTLGIAGYVPNISPESVISLLKIMSSSMLVIATFAVASMVSAYASASTTATPRSFSLIIADDISQNALSAFIGTFIFSIVALVAMQNNYYDLTGRFAIFVLTLVAFTIVILTFVSWVDKIARLGRLGNTVDKVEVATAEALQRRRCAPTLRGLSVTDDTAGMHPVYATKVGYVQIIELAELQEVAEELDGKLQLAALPGTFAAPGRVLAYVSIDANAIEPECLEAIRCAFIINHERTFDDDPRFGLITLSEIASRALSPGINDPGTAIDVIGTLVRLFADWAKPVDEDEVKSITWDRVAVPELALADMFEDAFGAMERDGAGTIEVIVRLLKALQALGESENGSLREEALRHARLTLSRAEQTLEFEPDLEAARSAACFATDVD